MEHILCSTYTSLLIGESIELEAIPSLGNIEWAPGIFLNCDTCSSVTSTPEYTLYYIVSREDNGCIAYDTVYIEVNEPQVFVPTAFTPNGDKDNDIFQVIDKYINELIVLRVFNRWGEMLYQTNDINAGWDGSFKGEDQEIDTYIYDIEVIMYTGKTVKVHGFFLLLR
ncbi:MAG: T9SS type B sorting domain-containing protein [Chitinophagales bacterium]